MNTEKPMPPQGHIRQESDTSAAPPLDDIVVPKLEAKDAEGEERQGALIANIPHVFEIPLSPGEILKLPLYPQTPGYIVLLTKKLLEVFARSYTIKDPKNWRKFAKQAEKMDIGALKALVAEWMQVASDELCEVLQLCFETGPFTGTFTVLEADVFKWYFTVPLLEEIIDVLVTQNSLGGLAKKVTQLAQVFGVSQEGGQTL